MKAFRGSFTLILLAAVLGGYAYWDYSESEQKQKLEARKDRLYPELGPNKIQRVELHRADLDIVLEKDRSLKWQLKAPVEDLGDNVAINNFLRQTLEKNMTVLETQGSPKWSDYGLGPEALKVTYILEDQSKQVFYVSQKTAFDGSVYVRREGQQELLLTDKSVFSLMAKQSRDFRSRQLFFDETVAKTLVLRFRGQTLRLVKDKDQWQWPQQPSILIDPNQVSSYFRTLKNLRVKEFVSETKGSTDRSQFGLGRPQGTIQVDDWKFEYTTKNQQLYAITNDREAIFRMRDSDRERLEQSLNFFRDKKQPFRFKADQTQKLRLTQDKNKVDLIKKEGQWQLVKPDPDKEVNEASVKKLLDEVSRLEVTEFLGTKSRLRKKKNRIQFLDNQDRPLLDLAWGETKNVGGKKLYIASSSLMAEPLGIKVDRLDRLASVQLVKPKGTTEQKKTPQHAKDSHDHSDHQKEHE